MKYSVRMPCPKNGWGNPLQLAVVKAETEKGALQKALQKQGVFEKISDITDYTLSEAREVYSDGLDVKARPVEQGSLTASAKYDEEADVWTIV